MLVYRSKNIRVMYDNRNQIYYVQKWMEGDNPRTYGTHYDFFTIKQFKSSQEVMKYLDELDLEKL